MSSEIQAAASSITSLTESYQAIAHNLANASTAGYKRRVSSFQRLLEQQVGGRALDQGTIGEVRARTGMDFSQGPLIATSRPLDLAIDGEGFFTLESPDGVFYTRSGSFRTNPQGQLVDAAGRLVGGEDGPITLPLDVPMSALSVSSDGRIRAGEQDLGRLRIVTFDDLAQLEPVGQNSYRAVDNAPARPADAASVQQGYTEGSNVNSVEELVNLIAVTRMYEANIKSVKTQDEKMRNLLQVASS